MIGTRIPIAGPSITEREVALVSEAAASAWQERAGEYHARFEGAFAAWVGREHAIALPSCTSAIHLALAALGVGGGDEVIVPELTWIASAAPIVYLGAAPVFADVDPDHWCLCPEALARAITPRTKAVVAVDLYGNMPETERLLRITEPRGIALVEDAAEAVGAERHGRRAGSYGCAGTFSFHGSKTMTTGEGGMLVTDDEALHRRSLVLRDHGRPPGDRWFFNDEVAFKYRMSAMQAAMGIGQLERIDELVAGKRRIFSWYEEELGETEGVVLNRVPPGTRGGYWMVTAVVDARYGLCSRDLVEGLDARGIDARPFFHPLSSLPAFAGAASARGAAARNPVAYDLSPRGVNLPSGLQLTRNDVRLVAGALREILSRP